MIHLELKLGFLVGSKVLNYLDVLQAADCLKDKMQINKLTGLLIKIEIIDSVPDMCIGDF